MARLKVLPANLEEDWYEGCVRRSVLQGAGSPNLVHDIGVCCAGSTKEVTPPRPPFFVQDEVLGCNRLFWRFLCEELKASRPNVAAEQWPPCDPVNRSNLDATFTSFYGGMCEEFGRRGDLKGVWNAVCTSFLAPEAAPP
jgi:hypothetical protein